MAFADFTVLVNTQRAEGRMVHIRDCPTCLDAIGVTLLLWEDGLWSTEGLLDAMAEAVGKCEAWSEPSDWSYSNPNAAPTIPEMVEALTEEEGWPADQDAFLMFCSSGLRADELDRLRRPDVDLRGEVLRVDGKGGRVRLVPVAGATLSMLRRRCMAVGADGLVFGSKHRSKTLRDKRLGPACEAAGVPRLTPHALRRFCSTELIESGADAKNYAEIMGHSLEIGLRDYAQSRAGRRRDVLEAAGLGNVMGGE